MTQEGPNGGVSASGRARAQDRFDERFKLHCQQKHVLRARDQFDERLKLKLREGSTQQEIGPRAAHPRMTSHTTAPAEQSRHKSADMTDIGAKNVSSRAPTGKIERSQPQQPPRGILHAKLERKNRDWQEKVDISSLPVYSMDQLPEIDGTLEKQNRRQISRANSMSNVESSSESVRKVDKSLDRHKSMDPAKRSASFTRQISSVPEDAFIEEPSWGDLEGVLHQTLKSSLTNSRTSCNDSEGITDEGRSSTIDEVKPKRRSRRKRINPSFAINDIADQPSTSASSWDDLEGVLHQTLSSSLVNSRTSCNDSEGITDERRSPTVDEVNTKRRSSRKCINPSFAINDIADQPSTLASSTSTKSSSSLQDPESWGNLDEVLQFAARESLQDLDVSLSDLNLHEDWDDLDEVLQFAARESLRDLDVSLSDLDLHD